MKIDRLAHLSWAEEPVLDRSAPIYLLPHRFHVVHACIELEKPSLWNRHRVRSEQYVHSQMSDIWVRYNDFANFNGDPAAFNDPHDSVWYPVAEELPEVVELVFHVMDSVRGEQLGGVLITKIPPGGKVLPHIDTGWHASYYDKFAVQLKSTPEQAFCFEGHRLSAKPGDLYTFDNSKLHWVENPSAVERITLIVCIRGHRYAHSP